MNENQMGTKTQLDAARSSALAIASPRSILVVTGADRLTWLNGVVTCDLAKKRPGEATYGLVVGRNGRVLADVIVFVDASRLLVSVPAAVAESLKAHFEHYLVMEDVEVVSQPGAFASWSVHGPRSHEVLVAAQREGGFGADFDRTGLGGVIVVGEGTHKVAVSAQIEHALGEVGGVIGDASGWRALRLERGVPEFGEDFDDTTYPQEAGLEKVAVSFEKGCYLGQEVVCMLEMRGHVNRRLASLVLETPDLPPPGTSVTDLAGVAVGRVTSAALSPTLDRVVAFAMIKRAQGEPANVVLIGSSTRAKVVEPLT
jgi:folate-binding protein YgfZ